MRTGKAGFLPEERDPILVSPALRDSLTNSLTDSGSDYEIRARENPSGHCPI